MLCPGDPPGAVFVSTPFAPLIPAGVERRPFVVVDAHDCGLLSLGIVDRRNSPRRQEPLPWSRTGGDTTTRLIPGNELAGCGITV